VLFHWREQDRQVRISGSVRRLSAAESDAYFESRPLRSRYAAAASLQSAPIADRQALEQAVRTLRMSRAPDALTRPPEWGGHRLRPAEYEFWQGRPGRLHDRFRYRKDGAGHWDVVRLQP
ncbi:MAG: pyridoxal 5'-phosphate synthase, partial [Gammaproteobacteria bacterium]|nr:pyridoxal 5'-phosphate synthase [Gammaproteobacteria bacterium]